VIFTERWEIEIIAQNEWYHLDARKEEEGQQLKIRDILKNLVHMIVSDSFYKLLVCVHYNFWYKTVCHKKYRKDLRRYLKYSFRPDIVRRESGVVAVETEIMLTLHTIEKALTLRKTRPLFGVETVSKLIQLVDKYKKSGYPCKSTIYQAAVNVLKAYVEYHATLEHQIEKHEEYLEGVRQCLSRHEVSCANIHGGAILETRAEVLSHCADPFSSFAQHRHSVRKFSSEVVSLETVKDAVRIAQTAPSACNRQSTRVHVITDHEMICQIAAIQGGLRGFEDEPQLILLVAADIECFGGAQELHQMFVDGSMFAMTLIYALNERRLGTCALHAGLDLKNEQALRKLLDLPESHCPVLFIAVGHYEEEFKVACSQRKSIDEIFFTRVSMPFEKQCSLDTSIIGRVFRV
jgi:nitroreductase